MICGETRTPFETASPMACLGVYAENFWVYKKEEGEKNIFLQVNIKLQLF